MASHRNASDAHANASLFFILAFVRRAAGNGLGAVQEEIRGFSRVCSDLVQPPPLRKHSARFDRSGMPISWLPLAGATTSMDVTRCPARCRRRYGPLIRTKAVRARLSRTTRCCGRSSLSCRRLGLAILVIAGHGGQRTAESQSPPACEILRGGPEKWRATASRLVERRVRSDRTRASVPHLRPRLPSAVGTFDGQGRANKITLCFIAADIAGELEVLFRFNTLNCRSPGETAGKRRYGAKRLLAVVLGPG